MNLLSTILDRLNQRIEVGNIFDQIYGLSEPVGEGNDKAWAFYIGNGQAIPVTNFDAKQGTLFWAKRGKITVAKNDSLRLAGCKSIYETRYSMTAYAMVRKSHLPCDSADAQDWVASRVLRLISGTDPQFKSAIGVIAYEVVPNGYQNEIRYLPVNYEWAAVAIDVDVNISTSSEDGCYDTCATGDIPLPDFEPCTPCLTEVAVDGVTITGNGTPADPLVAIGGGGGGGTLIALPFTTDHLSATGNAYAIGNIVWYNGNVYRCIAANDSILPTNTSYWVNLGAGFPTVQQPSDWNATSGNNQILNKPTIPAAQVNSDWNAVSGVAEILNKPTIPVLPATIVEDVTATAPLSSSGGTTPDISISQADTTTDGYLSSADWNTFDGKFDVPTGTSSDYLDGTGAPTPFPTIPPTIVEDVTATAPIASSGGATPDISISQAGAASDGYLSSADWTTFNGKFDTPTGTNADYLDGTGTPTLFPTIPPPQVNSDWNASSGVAEILNKPSIPSVTPSALTKTDDTNVTLTLGGSPSTSLLAATSLTLGWSGTLADSRIASAATWNAKQNAITTGTTLQYFRGDLSLATFPSIPAAQIQSDWTQANNAALDFIKNKPTLTNGTVTSVSATVPTALSVTVTNPNTTPAIAITAAGLSSQYIRGDGQLANFPTSSGGGSSLSYYLNGSVAQGTLGGVAFKQMSGTPVIGAGTNFTINADGYIQSFITDASVPNQLAIPAGNWNFEMYFSANSNGGTPRFYIELYKLSAATLTLLASSSANPEFINNGTQVDLYTTAVAVPSTILLAADRLAIRVYVIHSGKTITLHTEDNNLCQVITTFSTGINALNGLTAQVQNLAVGTSGTDFAISSASSTHTFNLPTASATNRGALSAADWTTFNGKEPAISAGTTGQYYRGDKTFQTLDKTAVGLGNVDNTSDANKPISTATQTALNAKFNNPSGTTAEYLRGNGTLATFPSLPIFYKSAIDSAGFSSVANTAVYTQGIAANTFAAGDIIRITYRTRKTGTAGNQTLRIYANTTANLSGSPILLAFYNIVNNLNIFNQITRHLAVKTSNNNTEIIPTSVSLATDMGSSQGVFTCVIDWTTNQFIVFAIQNTNAGDTNFGSMYLIEKL
jgi:hypothetical protein